MDPNDTNSQLQAWFLFMIQQIIASQGATIPHPSMQHSVGPVMGQHYQHPYQPPPSRSQHSGRHRTEARYPNHCIPRSSGTTSRGWSTNNTGTGSAHTPPPSNASMLDSNLVQARRSRPYDRDRSGPSIRRPRRPRTDLSVYAVPLVEAQSMLISQSIHYLLSTTLYSKHNSRWIEYPRCSSIAGAIDAADIGTISTVDIGAISITTCRANGSSCHTYVGLDGHPCDTRRGRCDRRKHKYARTAGRRRRLPYDLLWIRYRVTILKKRIVTHKIQFYFLV
ncbi:hypothetical protein BYT27DRAFT_7205850 [Phlegmacium glaucopus]|nr:hypothetical protein BYT27DRAFT_7205850 [Phlegmacium glaucopus]